MNAKTKSITTILLLSTLSYAGGDIVPIEVEPTIETGIPVILDNSAFYLGLGLSTMKLENDSTKESFKAKGITFQAGYQYNNYLAIEGRYTSHVGDVEYDHGSDNRVNAGVDIKNYPTDFTNIAIYLKPMYTINQFSAYALLGYGEVKLTNIPLDGVDRAEDGFQWGLGLAYDITEELSVYADYVMMYDDKGFNYRAINSDIKVDAMILGITYKF